MLVLLSVYVASVVRTAPLDEASPSALLALLDTKGARLGFTISCATARDVVEADPLDQRFLNVAMVANARATLRSPANEWFMALSRLGWHDISSRQNLMLFHAKRRDVVAVIDDIDGLLRRDQLIDQLSPALIALEGDPAWQGRVVAKLRDRPAWRFGFLQRGSLLSDLGQLAARARTIRALQHTGDDVAAGEIAPVLPKLIDAGLGQQAFAIWQAREPAITRPIADANFAGLAAEHTASNVPFHWQLSAAPDYNVEAALRPAPHLSISWNGVGSPVFASQTMSTVAGRYELIMTATRPALPVIGMIGARALCSGEIVNFDRVRRLSSTRVAYGADRAVPCAFPRLELYGIPGGRGPADIETGLDHIAVASAS